MKKTRFTITEKFVNDEWVITFSDGIDSRTFDSREFPFSAAQFLHRLSVKTEVKPEIVKFEFFDEIPEPEAPVLIYNKNYNRS